MNQWVGDVRKRAPYRDTKKIQKTIVTRDHLTGPSEGRKKTQREQVYRDAHTCRLEFSFLCSPNIFLHKASCTFHSDLVEQVYLVESSTVQYSLQCSPACE